MCLLARKKLEQRLVEVAPHPLTQNYVTIEIDIPYDMRFGKNSGISTLSLVSECIRLLSDPSGSRDAPALHSNQKYGRVYCRVRTASVDAACEDLKQYLEEMRHYLKHPFAIPWRPVSLPFKCRRGTHSPVLLVMRWREGGKNRLCLSPMVIILPKLHCGILLDICEEEGDDCDVSYEKYTCFTEDAGGQTQTPC
jgi:hypothetical protein